MEHAREFYIDGKWVAPLSSETLAVINPATEEAIESIAMGGPDDVDVAVAAARAAFETYSLTTREERLALLDRIIEVYKGRMGELGEVISQEMGAPLWMAQRAQAGAGLGHLLTARRVLAEFEFEEEMGTTLVVREPIGVCALITPVELAAQPDRLQGRAGARRGLHDGPEAVRGGAAERHRLRRDPRRGRRARRGVQPRQRRRRQRRRAAVGPPRRRHGVVHRLDPRRRRGGPSGRPDGQAGGPGARRQVGQHHPRRRRLRQAPSPATSTSMCNNSGQSCNAPTRMLVPAARMDEAAAIAAAAAEQIVVGDPTAEGSRIGPVVSAVQYDRIQQLIEKGIGGGRHARGRRPRQAGRPRDGLLRASRPCSPTSPTT